MNDETEASARVHGERTADQLLADLYANVIPKIGLDEIERAVAGRYISIPAPRPSLREIVDWTVRFVVEKAADLGELRGQTLVGKRPVVPRMREQTE